MCGIAGLTFFKRDMKIDPGILKNMTDVMEHRGPDDEGFYINQNVGLGFRRLSIIDLATGHQPLANEDETIWIIFNGEIYNFRELQDNLLKQGHVFRTKSDTETIVHLYEQYGTGCLQYLRGMFAFAIWDSKKNQLFCARDRFGIKPFYYYLDHEKLVFGSEIKAILKCDGIDKALSPEAIDSYFAFGYITSDLSIYKKIKKLQPAHYLLLSFKGKVSVGINNYWKIHFNPDFSKSEIQWEEEIQNCLTETVKMHMISDVPLGAFLSGGIDSGSVVSMMANNSSRSIKTFTIGFKDEKDSELKYARELATKYGCEHHEQIVEPDSIDLLPKLIYGYDEPFADPSIIPTYYVSKLARQFVTVALSGDGGDELFAGYNSYRRHMKIYKFPFNFNSPFYSKIIWGNIYKMMPYNMKGKSFAYYLSKGKKQSFAFLNAWSENERNKLLIQKRNTLNGAQASEHFKATILQNGSSKSDQISNMQYLDLSTYMVDDILTKVDRASMMNSLEVRVPLLDHKFAELSFRIPGNLKLNNLDQKYIFKKAMRSNLPQSFMKLPKKGFSAPISQWFKGGLQEYVGDTLLSDTAAYSEYLNKKYVRKVLQRSENSNTSFSNRIWSLLIFEEWLKQNKK
ncbi:MAG: asparagine synthase (glutamine-hydrolyzing) [Sphingobacteriales bacterium UTBCD1]|jgi:asparagine synthase (glutamine-hydrolysing)|nr:MAG: asparagine synthase (glutamine-hydrolyzing) [Sphingobacteriales bacterium UTBCD1]